MRREKYPRPQNLVLLPQILVLKRQLPAQQPSDGRDQRQARPVEV